jgi:hypothetical protein
MIYWLLQKKGGKETNRSCVMLVGTTGTGKTTLLNIFTGAEVSLKKKRLNVYGAQKSIPRNRFNQPMSPGGPIRQTGLPFRPARRGIDSWAPKKVYKYGLCIAKFLNLSFEIGYRGLI